MDPEGDDDSSGEDGWGGPSGMGVASGGGSAGEGMDPSDDDDDHPVAESSGSNKASAANKGGGRGRGKSKGPPAAKKKRQAKGRKKKPSDMPRRPLSAYNYFFREERARWLAEGEKRASHKDEAGGLFSAMGKAIAKRWKELTPKEAQKYKDLASEDMERYKREMDEYHTAAARIKRLAGETKVVSKSSSNTSSAAAAAADTAAMGGGAMDNSNGRGGGDNDVLAGKLPLSGGMDPYNSVATSQNRDDLLRSGGAAGGLSSNADFLRMQQGFSQQGFPMPGNPMGLDPSLMGGVGPGRPPMYPPRLNQPAGVGPLWGGFGSNAFGGNAYLDSSFAQGDALSGLPPHQQNLQSLLQNSEAAASAQGAAALRAQLLNSSFVNPLQSQYDQGRPPWGMSGGPGGQSQQQFLQSQQQQMFSMMGGGNPNAGGMPGLLYGGGSGGGQDTGQGGGSAGSNPGGDPSGGGAGGQGGSDSLQMREERMMMLQQLLQQQQQQQARDRDDSVDNQYM